MEEKEQTNMKNTSKYILDNTDKNSNFTTPNMKLLEPQKKSSKTLKHKHIKFKENLIEVILVESYKEYNTDISVEPVKKEKVNCNCLII